LAPQPPLGEHADDVVLTWAWAHVEAARAGERRAAAQALAALGPLLARADAGGLRDLSLWGRLLAVAAHDAAGDAPSALRVLAEALGPLLAAGYQGAFLSLGEPMRRLVAAALAEGAVGQAERPAALRLLARFPRSEPAPQSQLAEPLSEREREVLALLGAGLSNAEIAERLVVALTTVKAHLRSIYAKLEVDSRTRALARARALGLIP
jgi:LuxR family maltose regulon positive regulatory protein